MDSYISVCFTTFNRSDLLFQATKYALSEQRVDEIVICDDCSDIDIFNKIYDFYSEHDKVKLFRNEKNKDCYLNKRTAVSLAKNEFVCIIDSDNTIDQKYIDSIYSIKERWSSNTILQPSFAKPHFDFRRYRDMTFDKHNVAQYIHDRWFETMLNACNFFVNRDEYLRIWDGSIDPVTSDSIYFNYRWLEAGNSIYVVPGMEYFHRVHEGSHYQQNVRRTPQGLHQSILNKLKAMK